MAAALHTDQMPVDVWIARDGRVRRMSYRIAVWDEDAGQTRTMRERVDYFGFGAAARITAPPPRQTTTIARY